MSEVTSEQFLLLENAPRRSVPTVRRWIQKYPAGLVSIIVLVLIALLCFVGPLLIDWNPNRINAKTREVAPSASHPLGTDELGREQLARVAYGGRVSLLIGFGAMLIGTGIGATLGFISGLLGRFTDLVVQRAIEIIQAIPGLIIVLLMVAMLGRSREIVMVTLGVLIIPLNARTMRGSVLSTREATFVEAAVALGASPRRIALRHILPQTIAPILVVASLSIGSAIIAEATLSFLGAGVQPPDPSWGRMVKEAMGQPLSVDWWLVIAPAAAIALTVIAVNFLGDALRDTLDPRIGR